MKINVLLVIICSSIILFSEASYPLDKKENIKYVDSILNTIYSPTSKLIIGGGVIATSPIVWNIAVTLTASIFSPFKTISYFATNPATATITSLVINQFVDLIKPLPKKLHDKTLPEQTNFLKTLFLKEYADIKGEKKLCSRLMWNPQEHVSGKGVIRAFKQPTMAAYYERACYRVKHNPIAALVTSIQLIFTLYAIISSAKEKSLENHIKGLAVFSGLYGFVYQALSFTDRKCFDREEK